MCNCEKKREDLSKSGNGFSNFSNNNYNIPHTKIFSDSKFEYTGKTALTVKGNITGKVYRFEKTGDVQIIDYRDTYGMYAIAVLKKIKS